MPYFSFLFPFLPRPHVCRLGNANYKTISTTTTTASGGNENRPTGWASLESAAFLARPPSFPPRSSASATSSVVCSLVFLGKWWILKLTSRSVRLPGGRKETELLSLVTKSSFRWLLLLLSPLYLLQRLTSAMLGKNKHTWLGGTPPLFSLIPVTCGKNFPLPSWKIYYDPLPDLSFFYLLFPGSRFWSACCFPKVWKDSTFFICAVSKRMSLN